MDVITAAVEVCAVTLLGLAAGAMAAEGAVLVPFWRSMPPQAFLAWYREHAALLLKFFGPLEVAAAASAIAAALANWLAETSTVGLWFASASFAVAVLAAFPAYFQRVNSGFAGATIPVSALPGELRRWSIWHWARVAAATTAFIIAAISRCGRP